MFESHHFKHICSVCAKEGLHMEHTKSRCPKGLQETIPSKSMGPRAYEQSGVHYTTKASE